MRVIFAGTPQFAASSLRSLIQAGHEIVLVMTQPDRPSGRGLKLTPSPVKLMVLENGLNFIQPDTLKSPEVLQRVTQADADVMVVVAYGLILPSALLNIPLHGCINVHASLLPRWRGAAPIPRAILAGDQETGISIMRMTPNLDSGAILLQQNTPISNNETARSLHDKLAKLGGECIVRALDEMQQGELMEISQDTKSVTYAAKLTKQEARIDWKKSATEIDRAIRAFNPSPGAHTEVKGHHIKIWSAVVEENAAAPPGQIIAISEHGIVVGCGVGTIKLTELQKSGSKRLVVDAFLRGFELKLKDRFEV